ncbi:MAG: hypothetical protein ACP5IY_07875, partial [Halothiobacillaceae bacterium]
RWASAGVRKLSAPLLAEGRKFRREARTSMEPYEAARLRAAKHLLDAETADGARHATFCC